MELFRTLVLVLSVPQADAAVPASAFITQARTLLVQPGMSPKQVERSLGLRKYRWSCTGFGGNWWSSTYLSPDDGHTVTVEYLFDPRTCDLRLDKVEIQKPHLRPK